MGSPGSGGAVSQEAKVVISIFAGWHSEFFASKALKPPRSHLMALVVACEVGVHLGRS